MRLVSRTIVRAALTVCQMTVGGPVNAAGPADPRGTWLTEDGRVRIRIERCGARQEQICGYVVWMKNPVNARGQAFQDQNNPDATKRSRAVLGHQLIMGLKPSSEARFYGQIYNAENGKSYDIALWREGVDKLKVKGCMMSVLCTTQSWMQTTDVLPGQLAGITGDPNGPRPDKEWAQDIQTKPPATTKADK